MNEELEQVTVELKEIMENMLGDLPDIQNTKSAARRVRSGLTQIKKVGKELRRLSLEHDKNK